MSLLLLAIPLQKSWLGIHYWDTPSIMELPVELEYIPYHELTDRLDRLNKIARPVYPTIWPNIVMLVIFSGLFITAAVGISRTNSGLSIMSQGACFVLPVIAILWIRIRKETKANARKKFKQRSQKLLRNWTAHDFATHAIQWKLRVRPKSMAKRWRRLPAPQDIMLAGMDPQPGTTDGTVVVDLRMTDELQESERAGPARALGAEEWGHDSTQAGTVPTLVAAVLPTVTARLSTFPRTPTGVAFPALPTTAPTVAMPRRVADVYSVLRRPQSHQQPEPQELEQEQATTAELTTPETATRSKWEPWLELLRDLYCCSYFFKEAKVWMIEISIREGGLDEYSVPVPSPAYCDYRLPGYEDIITGAMLRATNPVPSPRTTIVGASGIPGQPSYAGLPPAYETDSDNDSDLDVDEHDPDDDEEDVNTDSGSIQWRSRGDILAAGLGERTGSTSRTGVHHPVEMMAVMTTSAPVGSNVYARTGSTGETQQDMITADLSSRSAYSATTVLTLVDKDEDSEPSHKEE